MSETITITKRLEFYSYTKDDCRFSYWSNMDVLKVVKNYDYKENPTDQWASPLGMVLWNNSRTWFKNGMWNREGAPAVVADSGHKKNYIMGKAAGGWYI